MTNRFLREQNYSIRNELRRLLWQKTDVISPRRCHIGDSILPVVPILDWTNINPVDIHVSFPVSCDLYVSMKLNYYKCYTTSSRNYMVWDNFLFLFLKYTCQIRSK